MQRCYHQKNTNTEQKSSNIESKNTEKKTLFFIWFLISKFLIYLSFIIKDHFQDL